ncbi:MAG TPA: amidohydrolase family protein [Methylomirabilota bacterium]|nr:amidohydrolase family protein [Methylomirabilota bacterium]
MPKVDAHQHFWIYSQAEYPWIQPTWAIKRSFLPKDIKPELDRSGFDFCVAVQARQSLEETQWLLELAREHRFIAGVVGWVDLRSDKLTQQLTVFSNDPHFVGVRHVVQDEPDDNFMLRADFQNGIRQLKCFNLAYDILIYPKQLPAAIALASKFPEQRFVLDHMAKPNIKDGALEPWATQIRELAAQPNVSCKISGLVTEAEWNGWAPDHFRKFLDVAWEAFGDDRLMVGSDWPVALNAAESHAEVMQLATSYLAQFPAATQQKFLGDNAIRFYNLKVS